MLFHPPFCLPRSLCLLCSFSRSLSSTFCFSPLVFFLSQSFSPSFDSVLFFLYGLSECDLCSVCSLFISLTVCVCNHSLSHHMFQIKNSKCVMRPITFPRRLKKRCRKDTAFCYYAYMCKLMLVTLTIQEKMTLKDKLLLIGCTCHLSQTVTTDERYVRCSSNTFSFQTEVLAGFHMAHVCCIGHLLNCRMSVWFNST